MNKVESHPLQPFFPKDARVLMLGSFPPPEVRWKMNFFYPNLQNDMWRIFGLIFYNDKNYFLTKDLKSFNEPLLRSFLDKKRVALWDTAMEIVREQENASDKFLKVLRPVDINKVLDELPDCNAIVLTGQKALEILQPLLMFDFPQIGNYSEMQYGKRTLRIYRMPSSSRAYPLKLESKAEAYRKMFNELHL
jgi:G:T/U-mismatch repair DNA glycosylase